MAQGVEKRKPQERGGDISRPFIAVLTQVPVDRSTRETVQHDPAQELGIRALNLFSLRRDLGGQLHA